MTVLVATLEGVWADRRESSGARVYRPGRKLVRGDGVVAGFCGDSKKCVRAMRAVAAGETDPDVLAKLCDGLLVSESGRWEMWEGIARRAPARVPFICHGSGYAEAQAFLAGAGSWDAETIRRALRYVARVRADCGDGIDRLRLDR